MVDPSPDNAQALQVEYQVLQSDSSAMVAAHWNVVGIFIGIDSLLAGAISYLVKSGVTIRSFIVIFIIGGASIAIIVNLWRWLDRVNLLVRTNENNMREIETRLGMVERHPPSGNGSNIIKCIYIIFLVLWTLLIFMGLVLLKCEGVS